MAILVKPERKELSFLKKIHENVKTMAFQGHTDTYTEEQLDGLIHKMNQDDPHFFYRFVYCDGCQDFVSETSWIFDEEMQAYIFSVIVRSDLREAGYGHESLRLMKEEAKKYGIHAFVSEIHDRNDIGEKFLIQEGFQCIYRENNQKRYRLVLGN